MEVCWQVTGVRRDAFAKVHPLVVEEMKPQSLRGFYIHPELYGQTAEKQIEWGRHPAMMKWLKETRERQIEVMRANKYPPIRTAQPVAAQAR